MPIAALKIEGGKPFGSCQRVQGVVDPGQWKAVFLLHVVQLPVVHTETDFPILVPDKNDGERPRCL
jgi:hypothetical protein